MRGGGERKTKFGWFLRQQGMILIDRRAGAGAMRRLLDGAVATVAAGRSVIILGV